ncbi:hypothetical protein BU17DRAFT_80075 [Hysterangium stoloniferum]|nr:hypothetical protein BU17DRAFT_80075 [Hysterangium stoloniferum]
MDVDDLHEVTFMWPDLNANEVILTGTFDNWSLSVRLTKTPSGFQGTVKLPWGSRTLYKYVVDGRWMTAQSQPQETDNAGNVNSVYESPSKPELPSIEGFANKPAEVMPAVVPELQTYVSKDYKSPEDVISNTHTSITPPVVDLTERATGTHTEQLVSEEMSEPSPSLPITSHTNGAADLVVGMRKTTDNQEAEPATEELPLLTTEILEVASDKPQDLGEVERVNVVSPSDEPPMSTSEYQSVVVLPLTKEAVTSSAEPATTSPATQSPIDKSALQTAIEIIASDVTDVESMGTAAGIEPELAPECDGSLQAVPAVAEPARQLASTPTPNAFGERDVLDSVVQKEEPNPNTTQTVSDDSSVKSHTSKKEINDHLSPVALATPSKAERLPSSESMKGTTSSSNSSKFDSVRKKRLSFFGKVKHFFLHDKDDQKDQKEA